MTSLKRLLFILHDSCSYYTEWIYYRHTFKKIIEKGKVYAIMQFLEHKKYSQSFDSRTSGLNVNPLVMLHMWKL